MKFNFWTTSTHTYIEAVFDADDSSSGFREEGSGVEITIVKKILKYDYVVEKIHPDILGLICLVNFFPFIGSRVEFPMGVSSRLEKAFKRKPFLGKKDFKFLNIEDELPIYKGNKIGIAFGGGVDSTAVHEMFPEAFVVHEAHIIDNDTHLFSNNVVPSVTHGVMKDMNPESSRLVTANQRYVSIPGGWHSWPCSTACLLLLATDKNIGLCLTGTVLGSNWLWNGNKFYNRFDAIKFHGLSGNYWQSVFRDIGIPMFSPIDGISEFGSMRLSIDRLNSGVVNYCMAGEKGTHCHKCSKCLRKTIERKLVDPNYKVDWSSYNTPSIHSFLKKRPLYFGHIFKFASKKKILPNWIEEIVSDVCEISTNWPLKYYPPALKFCPEPWKVLLKERISNSFEYMDKEEIAELEAWTQE
jgi:hypothetical protein